MDASRDVEVDNKVVLVKEREAGTLQSFLSEGLAAVNHPGRVPESPHIILLLVLLPL